MSHLGRFAILDRIGEGMTSVVCTARDTVTGGLVAIKRISKNQDESTIQRVRREIDVMTKISHPFIVSFYDVFEDEHAIHIVMEHCPGGSLKDLLDIRGPLDEEAAKVILAELVIALAHVQKVTGVIHRDVKLDNVLLDMHGHVRLCDFGFAKECDVDAPKKQSACGSPAFTAPEVIKRDEYTGKADVWSCGVCLYMLVFNTLPFQGESVGECIRQVVLKELEVPSEASDALTDLLTHMLDKDWRKRYSFEDVLAHPWVKSNPLFSRILEFNSAAWVFDPACDVGVDIGLKAKWDREVEAAMGCHIGSLHDGFRTGMQSGSLSERRLQTGFLGTKGSMPVIKAKIVHVKSRFTGPSTLIVRRCGKVPASKTPEPELTHRATSSWCKKILLRKAVVAKTGQVHLLRG